ncbi:MAG: DUF3877 family protein [Ruminococcus sp.]|uniref:DUF3877 family protein n=1 Tax=Ruminococcus sp. TaxID=41978 RepID=UPI0025CBA97A|nr:DUF3877 family protein [Ruminococcus sp.]MBR6996043.1 DUF3877 family protein [Ruminococcus sp.]
MDFKRLEKNLCDNIYEAQLKLGYDKREMSFNYMSASLKHLIGSDVNEDVLLAFADETENRLGRLTFRPIKNGFCITIPAEGTEYVHNSIDDRSFMEKLVSAVASHCSTEPLMELFRSASSDVVIKEINNEEFRYLVYFPDNIPDEYYYCISEEEEIDGSIHASYHRFIREDYEDLGF